MLKWVGVVATVGIVAVWAWSHHVSYDWMPTQTLRIRVFPEGVVCTKSPSEQVPPIGYCPPTRHWYIPSTPPVYCPPTRQWWPCVRTNRFDTPLRDLPGWKVWVSTRSLFVPHWLFAVLFALPTAILWYRDRRPPKGHCQNCGYNLTGNVTGICPECGEPI